MKTGTMKIGTTILTTLLAAGAWAEGPAVKTAQTKSAEKPAAILPVSLPTKTTPPPPAKIAAPATPAAKSAKPAAGEKSAGKPAAKSAEKQDKTKSAQQASPAKTGSQPGAVRAKKRDPFVSPIVERAKAAATCVGIGKRCLYVGDLNLIGIVESSNGIIAVVASGRHTYFLREHDPLADGDVERITSDAITIKQRSSDLFGRPVVREVTRRIGAPAV